MPRIKATHHMVFIAAKVHGPEVADMMRYDNCAPANEEHAHKLVRAISGNGAEWVVFKRFVLLGAPIPPNVGRWKSFNIPCIPSVFETVNDAEVRVKEVETTGGKMYADLWPNL